MNRGLLAAWAFAAVTGVGGCSDDTAPRTGGPDGSSSTGSKADDSDQASTGGVPAGPFDLSELCLASPQRIDWSGVPPREFVDVDGDTRAELLSTAFVGDAWAVQAYLGDRDSPWNTVVETAMDPGLEQLIDDVDGDGQADILVVSDVLSVYYGGSDGRFTVAPRRFSLAPYVAFAPSDFDGDGRLDLVAATYQSTLQTLRGLGDGDFVLMSEFEIDAPQDAVSLFGDDVERQSVGLLNGVAAGCLGCDSSEFSLVTTTADGTLQLQASVQWSAAWSTIVPTVGELFGGGPPEVIVELGLDQRSIFTVQGQELVATGALTNGARDFGDLNGDGVDEMVIADEAQIRVFTDGGDQLAEVLAVESASAPQLWVADVDGDGAQDVITFDPVGYDPSGGPRMPFIEVRRAGPCDG